MSAWLDFLATQGAILDGGRVRNFGDPAGERERGLDGAICADLSPLSVLAVRGEDARDFLNAQFTCDVKALSGDDSILAGWCDPKGRVLFLMLVARADDGMRIILPSSLAASLQRRLGLYILRSRVTIEDISAHTVLLGLSGPEVPTQFHRGRIALPGMQKRWILSLETEHALQEWQQLRTDYHPVGWPCWEMLDILAGLPGIDEASSGCYLPQMLNLDALGGLSYQKGCYPGQEVIARLHYRGEIKRRLQLAFCPLDEPPATATDILTGSGDKAGTLLRAAPLDTIRSALQIVLELAHRDEALSLGEIDGPLLELQALPYPLP